MNLIPKIAEMLGVEIGEEFKVENDICLHRFTENGLEYNVCGAWSACARLNLILNGTEKIIKLSFEPKEGESYWYVYWGTEYIRVADIPFEDEDMHYHHKYCGNCFRTKEEAEKHKYEIYEKLTGRNWEEEQ